MGFVADWFLRTKAHRTTRERPTTLINAHRRAARITTMSESIGRGEGVGGALVDVLERDVEVEVEVSRRSLILVCFVYTLCVRERFGGFVFERERKRGQLVGLWSLDLGALYRGRGAEQIQRMLSTLVKRRLN